MNLFKQSPTNPSFGMKSKFQYSSSFQIPTEVAWWKPIKNTTSDQWRSRYLRTVPEILNSRYHKSKTKNSKRVFASKKPLPFTGAKVLSNEGSSLCKQTKKKKKKGTLIKRRRGKKELFERAVEPGPYGTLRDRGKKKKQKEQKRKREWGWPRLKVKNRRDLVVPFKATKQSRDRARLKSSGNTSQSRVPVSTRVASVRFLVNYPRGRPRRAA